MQQREMPVALISVYDKEGIGEFARGLVLLGWKILSTGGTAVELREKAGLSVLEVSDFVGQPLFGDLVKTLSREIATGLLPPDTQENRAKLAKMGLPWISLVCVDLYPLEEAVTAGLSREEVKKKTDIGGPTMLREGAKGDRIVVCDPDDRMPVLEWLKAGSPDELEFVTQLEAKAERLVSKYSAVSAAYLSDGIYDFVDGELVRECKYGENAWQSPAAHYSLGMDDPLALERFEVVLGSKPSYNNLVDLDRSLQTLTHIVAALVENYSRVPYVAIAVKHGNACGVGVASDTTEALQKAVTGDKRAIFGGLVITNFPISQILAEVLVKYETEERRILDVVAAPEFTNMSMPVLQRGGGKCKLLSNPTLARLGRYTLDTSARRRQVRGGYLLQPNYTFVLELGSAHFESIGEIDQEVEKDLLLAWAIGSTSNSNTITLVKDAQLISNGVGQQDRVSCCELAVKRARDAGHDTKGSAAYSDSFFPFPDGPKVLADAGVRAILTTSGSVRDRKTIELCQERGVTLCMMPDELARGFYGH